MPRGEGGATRRGSRRKRDKIGLHVTATPFQEVWSCLCDGGEVRGWRHPAFPTVSGWGGEVLCTGVVGCRGHLLSVCCASCRWSLFVPHLPSRRYLVGSILVLWRRGRGTFCRDGWDIWESQDQQTSVLDKGELRGVNHGGRRQSRREIRWLVSANDAHPPDGPLNEQRPERRWDGAEARARRGAPLGNE